MAKVIAGITTSVDGYITGPDDGPDKGLGEGGERLHYWVFGGPWSYQHGPQGEPDGEDAAYLANKRARVGGRSWAATCTKPPATGARRTRSACPSSWSPTAPRISP